MVRNYKRKTVTSYSAEELLEAIFEIKNKKCSIRSTAKKYDIPYNTLRRWVVKSHSRMGSGRNTYMTEIEEQYLVNVMKYAASCGYHLKKSDLINVVQGYFESSRKPNPFPNNCPGPDWIRNFEKRWEKELGEQKPEILTKSPTRSLTNQIIHEFFERYENFLNEHKLWDQSHRIFNAIETGLSRNQISNQVYMCSYKRSTDRVK